MKHDYLDAISKLDLMHTESHSPGFAWWHPAGRRLLDALKAVIREVHETAGYDEVKTPNLSGTELFEISGHLAKFRQNMMMVQSGSGDDSREYALRPMSCPNHILLYKQRRRSYAELPIRLMEFGEVVRDEPSGSLQTLFRMRGFCQDDSHVFAMNEQVVTVVSDYIAMARKLYTALGFESVRYQISLRPTQRHGDDALWDKAEEMLRDACRINGLDWDEEVGGGAFYGPKLELHLTDKLGRSWQLGTIQLDYVLPERFDLHYLSSSNEQERPVILHHAVLGSLERIVGVLLEQYGETLPGFLQPTQLVLISASAAQDEVVEQNAAQLRKRDGFRVKTVTGSARLGDKVKAGVLQFPTVLAVIGDREVQAGTVAIREGKTTRVVPYLDFVQELRARCEVPQS